MQRTAGEVLFAHIVGRPDGEMDLAAAVLVAGEFAYPNLDVAHYLGLLDDLAAEARRRAGSGDQRREALEALVATLFEDGRFRANAEDYYDPRNSFLNEVLDRRVGIPLTLSIVFIEVGRRIGLDVAGLSFPGHFLVRYVDNQGLLVLDPFNGGIQLSAEELRERLRLAEGPNADVTAEHLEEAGNRQILGRMLTNLAMVYARRGDHERHLAVVERMLILDPDLEHLTELQANLRRRIAEKN